jgi:hypothetical protein
VAYEGVRLEIPRDWHYDDEVATTQTMAEPPLAKCHDLIVCVLVPEQRAC